jgi:hypothetical protein
MAALFSAQTRLEAWLDATEHLLQTGPELNVILSISSPASDGPVARAANERLNTFYASEDQAPLHTIAETIFPGWEYQRRGLRGVYEVYPAAYDVMKKGDPRGWGTYAIRLVRRKTGDGSVVNPLHVMITKMRDEVQTGPGGTKTACYEIGVAEGEYDLPLYGTVDDQRRRLGLPCLSHLSFKLYGGSLHLTAIYRSHDYRYKVPGNLLGLARLQACVSKEVGVPIGTLVVHSTYAWTGRGKGALNAVVADLRAIMSR